MKLLTLFSLFAILMALDVGTTWYILASGGSELNPIALPFLAYGVMGLVVQKVAAFIVISSLVVGGVVFARRRGLDGPVRVAYAVLLLPLAAFPVFWNMAVIA